MLDRYKIADLSPKQFILKASNAFFYNIFEYACFSIREGSDKQIKLFTQVQVVDLRSFLRSFLVLRVDQDADAGSNLSCTALT